MLILSLVLAATIWLTPSIVAHTPLRHFVPGLLFSGLAGRVHIERAELGWNSVMALHDVTIRDRAGRELLTIKRLQTGHSLLKLLADTNNLGPWQLREPTMHVVTRPGSSNLEEMLGALGIIGEGEPGGEPTEFRLTIDRGTLHVSNANTGIRSDLHDVRADVDVRSDGVHIKADARPVLQGQAGRVELSGIWPGTSDGQHSAKPLKVNAKQLPLRALEPLLARFGISGQLYGQADVECSVTCDFRESQWAADIIAQIQGQQWQIRLPQYTGEDAIAWQSFALDLTTHITPQTLQLEQARVAADDLQVQASGQLPWSELVGGRWSLLWQDPSPNTALELAGHFDATALAAVLPRLLPLRSETKIDGGHADFQVRSQVSDGRRSLSLQLTTDQFKARRGGQILEWSEPVQLEAVLTTKNGVTVIEHLRGSSDFFTIDASALATNGKANWSADLSALAQRLNDWVDCGIQSMQGQAQGQLQWNLSAEHFQQLNGTIDIQQLSLVTDNGQQWDEPHLRINLQGEGMWHEGRLARADRIHIDVLAGDDSGSMRLSTPTPLEGAATRLPFDVALSGDLQRWLSRLRPWLGWDDVQSSGRVDAVAEIELSADQIWVSGSRWELADMAWDGFGLHLREPMAQLEAQCRWDLASSCVHVPQITLTSTSVAARGANILIDSGSKGGYRVDGDVAARGDLQTVTGWFSGIDTSSHRVRGEFELRAQVRSENTSLVVQGNMTANPFAVEELRTVARPIAGPAAIPAGADSGYWRAIWNDQQVQLLASLQYDWQSDQAQLDKLQLISEGIRASASGTIATLQEGPVADIQGEVDYDLQAIVSKLYSVVGPGIFFRGRQRQPFEIQGPLTTQSFRLGGDRQQPTLEQPATTMRVSPELTGQASMGWDMAKIHGLTLDATQLTGHLQDGVLALSPIALSLGDQGRLSLSPRVELNGVEPCVVVGAGRIAENVRITPELCRSWLRYVAPIVSSATAVDGQFSLDLAGATVPLGSFSSAECSGSMAIHHAQLKPGRMTDQIVGMVDQLSRMTGGRGGRLDFLRSDQTWLQISEQTVPFQLTNGRVHHQGLEVRVDDVVIRTSGWVGLDQSMSLVAEIPVLDEWVANERWLAGMRGQLLRIPVQGTLTQPQLDPTFVGDITRQMLGNRARQALGDELRKRLFDGAESILEGR